MILPNAASHHTSAAGNL